MTTRPVSKKDILALINKDWKTRDQGYDLKKAALEARLKDLNTKFQEDKRPVSFQMSLEAGWLLNYTDDWPRLSAALDRLEASLAETASPLTPAAQCADGSWGPGCTEWYRKLEPTFSMLRLQDFVTGKVPKESVKPLAFMQPLADWSYTKAYLDRLRTSDIVATGRNHRDEFGALQTALSQFAYIPELTKVLSDYPGLEFKISDDFRTNYTRYLIDLQNPDTGFWGPSYRFQGSSDTVELQDIAFSFHIVHYWKESGIRIPRPRQIADTILDYGVQNEVHPYGWLTDHKDKFRYSNHNNFDTLILLKYSWSGLDAAQRDYATTKLQMLFEWCLKESLSPKGDCFERFRGPVTVDDYYYGVCFLDDIGFWDTDAAFRPIALWPGAPEPKALARSLLDGFLAHKWTTTKPGEHVVRILRKYT